MTHLKLFAQFLESKATTGFLELLLNGLRLTFLLDGTFRRNLEGFQGRYLFRSQDGSLMVHCEFKDGKMTVGKGDIEKPNVTVNFRNDQALLGFLLAPKPDILGAVLRQDVVIQGNLNYLYKFAFMAKRLQIMALGHA